MDHRSCDDMVITLIQLFIIGFSFGIAGPCLFSCAPILAAYIVGQQAGMKSGLVDAASFLFGRFLSYLFLGGVAGLSAIFLRRYFTFEASKVLHIAAGMITVILGICMIFKCRRSACACGSCQGRHGRGGLFVLGIVIGLAPCTPLITLLFDVTLMAKTVAEGVVYMAAFGVGSVVSGAIIALCLVGAIKRVPARYIEDVGVKRVFRFVCAAILIMIGLYLSFGSILNISKAV